MRTPLLIVGAGRLGRRVGHLWQDNVTAETRTTQTHASLVAAGMTPRIRSSEGKFPNIVFSVPPLDTAEGYEAEIRRALSLWEGGGTFLMVSSTAVYIAEGGEKVTEGSPEGSSARAQKLLRAEKLVRAAKGSVVRLVGLYDKDFGPHRVYSEMKNSELRGDAFINLIHYDDAATLCIRALDAQIPSALFLGCDDKPLTRHELSHLAAKLARKADACRFLGSTGPKGKCCDNSATRKTLSWAPRWKSFSDFVDQASYCPPEPA